jgi:alkylation response protein AidB-like acyl-CoA dehydrogenase
VEPGSPPHVVALRDEVRGWLADHFPPDLAHAPGPESRTDPTLARHRAWNRALHDAGYATASWPEAFGGWDASPLEQLVLMEELDQVGAPSHLNTIGLHNIGPSIMQWGTLDQQARHLAPMARADEIWCQGFSEPGAGSDLASLTCRADRDGMHYVVNGQKVWTSMGHWADWCELLVRTDASSKHGGITCLLLDMTTPGIEARPLTTMAGSTEFAEVFLTDVRVPVANRLGPENEGWKVAMTTLAHERAGVAAQYLMAKRHLRSLFDDARGEGRACDALVRQRLARLHTDCVVLELLAKRSMLAPRPGPEGSLLKIAWSEIEQRIAGAAADILGPATSDRWATSLLDAQSMTIAGGTSLVNRNIVAERVLGLPKG